MKLIKFRISLFVLSYLFYEISHPITRHFLAKNVFEKTKILAKKKNKKLMVIGDPCNGNAGNIQPFILFPNCKHGDITIDLFGCNKCDKMDINNIKEWKKYKSNEYVIMETGTLSFGKDLIHILREIKRISGGDFFSAGGSTSLIWKYVGNKWYSRKYPNPLQSMIYPFDSSKDKYYL